MDFLNKLFIFITCIVIVLFLLLCIYLLYGFFLKQYNNHVKEIVLPKKYRKSLHKKNINEYCLGEYFDFLYDVPLNTFLENYRSFYGFIKPACTFKENDKFKLYLYEPEKTYKKNNLHLILAYPNYNDAAYAGSAKDFNFFSYPDLIQIDKNSGKIIATDISKKWVNQEFQCLTQYCTLLLAYYIHNYITMFFLDDFYGIYAVLLPIGWKKIKDTNPIISSLLNKEMSEQIIKSELEKNLDGVNIERPIKNIVSTIKLFDKFGTELYRDKMFWTEASFPSDEIIFYDIGTNHYVQTLLEGLKKDKHNC